MGMGERDSGTPRNDDTWMVCGTRKWAIEYDLSDAKNYWLFNPASLFRLTTFLNTV
jgi:hypothetical protein